MTRELRRWPRRVVPFVGVMAALLAAPGPAAGWELFCAEIWNPHGKTIPPAGWTTSPGVNPNSGQNPDGFYQVGACNLPGGVDEESCSTGICQCKDGEEAQGGVLLYDGCDAQSGFSGHQYVGTGPALSFDFGTVVKYVEANGAEPRQDAMGSNNGKSGTGQAGKVDWQLFGNGDLLVCDAADPTNCICCYVPPPPKGNGT